MTAYNHCHWRDFREPLVRELAWCLFSPPVLDHLWPQAPTTWPVHPDRGAAEILAALDREPAPLKAHLALGNDRRLGARFEALWSFFLEAHPRYELLAHNLPVYRDGETLGALDLLFADTHEDRVIHGEIAVKFYLYRPGGTGTDASEWIGPTPDDTLGLKIERLRHHQLPLSSTPEAKASLHRHKLPEPDYRAALIKGWLFRPRSRPVTLPAECNPDCLTGEWLYRTEMPTLIAEHPKSRWTLLAKEHWLAPDVPLDGQQDFKQRLEVSLNVQRIPVMIAGTGEKALRYWILPDGWPNSITSTQPLPDI